MREAQSETDWASLLPEVARRLLGEPPRTARGGDTWRYGTKGSLSVHVGGDWAGRWHHFETGKSGGTLDLVQRELQCDKAAALQWLEDKGLIERRAARGGSRDARAQTPAPRTTPPRPSKQPQPSKTAPQADAILRAAVPADDTPARKYLAQRWTWPLVGIGPDLPTTVRYVDAGDMPEGRRDDGAPYRLLPAAAAGCVVFVLTDPAGRLPPAAHLEAVTADGRRLDWCGHERWRRTYGSKTGLVFEARNVPGGHLWLVEGECDALALTLCGYGGVIRSVPTGGYQLAALTDPERRNVVLVPDCDVKGDEAGLRFYRQALEANMTRRVRLWPPAEERLGAVDTHRIRGDPADWLEGWFTERAGIREYDGSMSRADADATAWNDVLSAIRRGEKLIPLSREGA